ncbi:unnamed protein product, partial [marine sediment metagenome]
MVHFWLPEGTDIRKTTEDVSDLEKHIQRLDGVTGVTSFIGQGAPRFLLTYSPEKAYYSYGYLLINIKDYHQIDKLIPKIETYTNKHHINAMIKQRKFILGPSKEDTIEIRFSGADPTVLRQLANKVKKMMYADGNVVGVKDDWRERVKTVRPLYAEQQARELGISKADLDRVLEMTYNGFNVGMYREYDKLLPILAIAPQHERQLIDSMKNIQIWSPVAQKSVPLRQVVSGFKTSWEDSAIQRRDRRPTITAQGTQKSGNASVIFERLRPKVEAMKLPPGYILSFGGEYEKSVDAQKALFSNIPIVIILMTLVLVMLFNALRQPLIIVLTVPLAVIGVTIGLLVTGQSFGFMALLGFLSLIGMLIKNSIVLIDQIDLEVTEGKPIFEAILHSSMSRLRPVSMAAVTTV